jgi:hypothetical protein
MPVKNTTMEAGSGTVAKVVPMFGWSTLGLPALPVTSMMSRFVNAYGIRNGATPVDEFTAPRLPKGDGIVCTIGGVAGGTVLLAVLVGEYQLWAVWVLPEVMFA